MLAVRLRLSLSLCVSECSRLRECMSTCEARRACPKMSSFGTVCKAWRLLCSSGRAARVQVARRIRCTVRGRRGRRPRRPAHGVPDRHDRDADRRRRLMRACGGRRRQIVRRECVGRFPADGLRVVFRGRQLLLQPWGAEGRSRVCAARVRWCASFIAAATATECNCVSMWVGMWVCHERVRVCEGVHVFVCVRASACVCVFASERARVCGRVCVL